MMKFVTLFVACLFAVSAVNAAETENPLIAKVYTVLQNDYINHISHRDITLKGLKSLEQTDPNIRLSVNNDKLFFYYKRRMSQRFLLPADSAGAGDWAALADKVLQYAVKLSPQAELHDFELSDRFARAVFKNLDGYSHYYGELDGLDDTPTLIRRQFAARETDGMLLIKIVTFQPGTAAEVSKALDAHPHTKGVILDLRGNHGGVLDEALQITDMFLDEGIIAYTAGKNGDKPHYYTAAAGDVLNNKPMVVLVDGFTASSAEVLAAALSEQNRAVLVGTQTYGKGTIQDMMNLGGGRTMALTTAYFYTPGGEKIDKQGLRPAVCTGHVKNAAEIDMAVCQPEDRFNEDADVTIAVKLIKNEL